MNDISSYKELTKSIVNILSEIEISKQLQQSVIHNISEEIIEYSFLEYIGITLSKGGLENFKYYFMPNDRDNFYEVYKSLKIDDEFLASLVNNIKLDSNIRFLDLSFSNSIVSDNDRILRFTFSVERNIKEMVVESLDSIIKAIKFEHCLKWIHSIAEILINETNTKKYTFHIVGFDYNLDKKNIEWLKVYYLGRLFQSADDDFSKGIYQNDTIRYALMEICSFIGLELTKLELIKLFDDVLTCGLNTYILGININKNLQWEFKIYFKRLLDKSWDKDKTISLIQNYLTLNSSINTNSYGKIFNVFEKENYKFGGLAVSFFKDGDVKFKLYFDPTVV